MLLETIGDTIENRILDFLIEGRGMDYDKKDIADACGVSRPTIYKILPLLVQSGEVKATRKVGRIEFYSINLENARVKILLKLEKLLLKESFAGAGRSDEPSVVSS